MAAYAGRIRLETEGDCQIINISAELAAQIEQSQVREGIAVVFCPGSTGAVTTIEFESGAVADLAQAIDRLAPLDIEYQHNARWGDGNGHSHVRSALLGPSLALPVSNGKALLGTWQQVVFIDFDNRSRHRELVVQVVGE